MTDALRQPHRQRNNQTPATAANAITAATPQPQPGLSDRRDCLARDARTWDDLPGDDWDRIGLLARLGDSAAQGIKRDHVAHHRLAAQHALAVDVGAVGRAKVLHLDARFGRQQPCMASRHAFVVQSQLAFGRSVQS
jgi:hypothetical protein